jgi:hypothetical protein
VAHSGVADIHQCVLKSTTSAGAVCDVREVRERRDPKFWARSSENNEPCSLVLHPMSSRCLSKILVARWESNSSHILGTWRALHRMLKKAVQQGRRRIETGGGTDRTSWSRSPAQWILANGKTPPVWPTSENLNRYVEDFDEPRTKLAAFSASC